MNLTPRKSLHDLRTMGRRVSDAEKPQRRFIQLAILELQKVRHGKEKVQTCRRIEQIDRRLGDIEADQAHLLAEMPHRSVLSNVVQPPSQDSNFTINY